MEATDVLAKVETTLNKLDATYTQHFSSTSISAVQTAYAQKEYLTQNPDLLAALAVTEDALASVIHDFSLLEQFITLHIPDASNGNIVHVSIQLQAQKQLREYSEALFKDLDNLPKYFAARADAMDKLGLPTKSNSESTKVESGDETKTTTTTEESTKSGGEPTYHRVQAVYAVDAQYYANCQKSFRALMKAYMASVDFILKNKDEIDNPKGKEGSSTFSSMYWKCHFHSEGAKESQAGV